MNEYLKKNGGSCTERGKYNFHQRYKKNPKEKFRVLGRFWEGVQKTLEDNTRLQ